MAHPIICSFVLHQLGFEWRSATQHQPTKMPVDETYDATHQPSRVELIAAASQKLPPSAPLPIDEEGVSFTERASKLGFSLACLSSKTEEEARMLLHCVSSIRKRTQEETGFDASPNLLASIEKCLELGHTASFLVNKTEDEVRMLISDNRIQRINSEKDLECTTTGMIHREDDDDLRGGDSSNEMSSDDQIDQEYQASDKEVNVNVAVAEYGSSSEGEESTRDGDTDVRPSQSVSGFAMLSNTSVLPPHGDMGKENNISSCTCKNSKCLKLYCACFAAEEYCHGCKCSNCQNTPNNEAVRKVIAYMKVKNPKAFKEKTSETSHHTGCKCKMSACLKKYCECFQVGITCGQICKCSNCENFVGSQVLIDRRCKIKDNKGAIAARHSVEKAAWIKTLNEIEGKIDGGTDVIEERSANKSSFADAEKNVSVNSSDDECALEGDSGKMNNLAPCTCKNSKCLKLYCTCFAAEQYCYGCKCSNCYNTSNHEAERKIAFDFLKSKPYYNQKLSETPHCKCKNSKCLKKYCECFSDGIACGQKCKCINCENVGSQKDETISGEDECINEEAHGSEIDDGMDDTDEKSLSSSSIEQSFSANSSEDESALDDGGEDMIDEASECDSFIVESSSASLKSGGGDDDDDDSIVLGEKIDSDESDSGVNSSDDQSVSNIEDSPDSSEEDVGESSSDDDSVVHTRPSGRGISWLQHRGASSLSNGSKRRLLAKSGGARSRFKNWMGTKQLPHSNPGEGRLQRKRKRDVAEERRSKNREHAKRSRARQKNKLESLQQQVGGLQDENSTLQQLVQTHIPTQSALQIIDECCSKRALHHSSAAPPQDPPLDHLQSDESFHLWLAARKHKWSQALHSKWEAETFTEAAQTSLTSHIQANTFNDWLSSRKILWGDLRCRKRRKFSHTPALPLDIQQVTNSKEKGIEQEGIALALSENSPQKKVIVYDKKAKALSSERKKRAESSQKVPFARLQDNGKWVVNKCYGGKQRYIGTFDTQETASLAAEIARDMLKQRASRPTNDQIRRDVKETQEAIRIAISNASQYIPNAAPTSDERKVKTATSAKKAGASGRKRKGTAPIDYNITGVRQSRSGRWEVGFRYQGHRRVIGTFAVSLPFL